MTHTQNYVCSFCGTPCYNGGYKGRPLLACECEKNGYWVQDYCSSYWQTSNGAKPIPIDDYIPNKKNK